LISELVHTRFYALTFFQLKFFSYQQINRRDMICSCLVKAYDGKATVVNCKRMSLMKHCS